MNKVIGILAHVDAGKTTFSEQLLYHTHAIRALGRVDRGDAHLDTHPLERERGITIFSGVASFSYEGDTYTLVDTPGHADFSAEMERALSVMDGAILLISCAEGVDAHTEAIWRLLRRRKIPTFLFLNKTDRVGADPARTLEELRARFSPAVFSLDGAFDGERLSGAPLEEVISQDDDLLARYFSGEDVGREAVTLTRRLVKECRFFPCLSGSALQDEGIDAFLRALHALTETSYQEEGPPAGRIYQIRHDAKGNRLCFVKLTGGVLRVRDEIGGEKITAIRRYAGDRFEAADTARAGELVAVTGLSLPAGRGFGGEPDAMPPNVTPMLSAQVLFDPALPAPEVVRCFRELADEDPALAVRWDARLRELSVQIMGVVQLEVLEALCRERFGLSVSFGPSRVLYKETVDAPATGYGHFEPLRHYAEVHLRLTPGAPGSGIVFESLCSTDVLDLNWQRLIGTHVLEKEHRGVLTGAPLTDVKISLLTGRAHLKHTEGGDFREATYRAIRQGLMGAKSVLLEPITAFVIEVSPQDVGRVLFDIQRMSGETEPPLPDGGRTIIRGRAPAACLMDYPRELISFTKGAGRISMRFDGYAPCHNAEEVIAQAGYDPERDLENTPDSVFCSHGAGYPVKWNEVENHIHCK
ncbi:elongation factor G [Zongyangia hominis]|uniref:TetM/TetW/TetO/TetS family tetracycline resistance ribosomal protection protein n=1 Tax=Zongyangia hominis TaxID=2763677 RepID=A0A926EDV9_9FIRM|nr:TetM/TetW/TetO/TetS family tetracycline resistance ribosomal protection protein [Zongyangia hominis]MBC8570306.1 TetM/TetW/TetO/TetS family tetracycline resistance ribosomal protection protein [Zongyangia hominis]